MTERAPPAVLPPRRVGGWVLLLVGVAAGVAMLPVARDLAHLPAITGRQWLNATARAFADRRAIRDLTIWWFLFAIVAVTLTRAPRRAAVAAALAVGVVVPVASFAHRAPLSNDLYRYAWDARVQAHGIDPYRYPPDDPHLTRLRTTWLWPDAAGCAELGKEPGCLRINRHGERTIYPPIAEGWFTVVAAAMPAGVGEDTGWELAGLVLDLAVTGTLLVALRAARADPRLIVYWSCCPLVAVEAVQNGHVDALAALFVVPAVALARRGRAMGAAAAGAAAILAKLYPALLLPAVIRGRRVKAGATALAIIALAYLPHVLAVGPRVLGYLPGYLREEGYTRGTRFLLLNAFGISANAAQAVAAAALVAVIAATWRRRMDPAVAAGYILVAAFLVATPAEPWYALTLVPLAVLARRPEWLVVCAAAYPLYLAILVGSHAPTWGRWSFGIAGAVVVATACWRSLGRGQRTAAATARVDELDPRPPLAPA